MKWWKVKLFFRDLFMPRYALLVELHYMPNILHLKDEKRPPFKAVPAIMRVPFRRPFFMPFNDWYNGMREEYGTQTMTICGSKRTLMSLYGVGSVNKHNMKRAVTYYPKKKNQSSAG